MHAALVSEPAYPATMPSSVPVDASPPMKPVKMTAARLEQEAQAARLNQALPLVPLPSPTTAAASTLVPPVSQRPARSSPRSLQTAPKPMRTMSYPVSSSPSIQLPPTVPEEGHQRASLGPLQRQSNVSAPVRERDSANSRYSFRRRASTSARPNSRPFQDGAAMDEDVLRYAEEIRKKRESKRRWREAEDEDRVIIGSKVDASHPNYVTAYNMLTGLRVAV